MLDYQRIAKKIVEDDEYATKVGRILVEDFGLKPSREHEGGFETESGWYTYCGIARRALRHLAG